MQTFSQKSLVPILGSALALLLGLEAHGLSITFFSPSLAQSSLTGWWVIPTWLMAGLGFICAQMSLGTPAQAIPRPPRKRQACHLPSYAHVGEKLTPNGR